MPIAIDRRLLIKAGAFGLAALSTPGVAQILTARGFTHGVASGEPSARSVLLWTRYVGSGETKLHCEVALDEGFSRIAGGGDVVASPGHDNCAKLVVTGLDPDKWYFYRFVAPDGTMSETGRTRTLPVGDVSRFGIGLFSCSNMPFGWFNAYAHAAARGDLDLMVHVGDYFYEYGPGHYPVTDAPERSVRPTHETVTLADYRLRFACYRLDPDLRRLHQQFPMIAQWDDHEFANDDWQNGAENHDPATEGPWPSRKAAAMRAYREWMPVSDALYNSFQIGSLATIFRPETRVTGRSQQLDFSTVMTGQADVAKALAAFRDGPWMSPERTLMGAKQEAWLYKGLTDSAKAGTRWQILAQEIVMGTLHAPAAFADLTPVGAPAKTRQQMLGISAAARAGLPYNMDSWDGYPAARERLLRAAREADCNLIVLSGDSHNAWGNELSLGGEPVGVEYAGHSVTSSGFESFLPSIAPDNLATMLRQTNPGLIFTDTSRRGYVSLELTPDAVKGTWHFMSTIAARTTIGTESQGLGVKWGERRFSRS
ncbi:alkaline phosphatase D family protein [Novosphingobium mangrovi (ex Huang et al. 2023)]|uniref:Alkaline phosphatase D family protein n=1 Tax=Novosphingobium mangrovi (ex Huang et al. 2023) TaxID=2976432 RepID=A0ABT2I9Q4_9SPHN|nr:alkaline phosphatase D family protein [Novosphingobium mangrovi (ex Huang et al. 2023)]MCT2401549.1 alkaline phosphatase D family protein [Novosphingobium mangrovi (ex Huang et al. 2023)]